MTLAQAKRLYRVAGGPNDHSESEWEEIRWEMQEIVNAKSDRAGGKVINWWCDWDGRYTSTAFARRVREEWAKMQEAKP